MADAQDYHIVGLDGIYAPGMGTLETPNGKFQSPHIALFMMGVGG